MQAVEAFQPRIDTAKSATVLQLMRPLRDILDRKDVTELTINRPHEVWAKTFGGWERVEVPSLSMGHLDALTVAMVTFNGMKVHPITSVVLPGGERGQIVRAPACIDGTLSLSIRKHAMVVKTLEDLEVEGAFAHGVDVSFNKPTEAEARAEAARHDFQRIEPFEVELLALKREGRWRDFLEAAVLAKRNVVVAGKTGSGKTTFARSMIEKVPMEERLVTIEDVHELFLEGHPNRVHMLYGTGPGRVSADECLASCMRQSPDRIFLAELRGDEAWEYVNSLNTGHPGSITTTHANNALQTFERIGTLIKKSEIGRGIDVEVIRRLLHTTVDVVLHFHERKLTEVFYDPMFAKQQMK